MASSQKSGGHYASGSFIGDGVNKDVTFYVGFKPDIVVVQLQGYDPYQTGWIGPYNIVIIKDKISYQSRHMGTDLNYPNVACNAYFGGTYPEYGRDNTSQYMYIGQYEDGYFTVSVTSPNNQYTRYIADATYSWEAYAKA